MVLSFYARRAVRTMLTQIPEALNAWAEQTPLLGKGGVDAPSRNIPVPLKGADGVVRSNSIITSLERTTPSAPVKVASQHFFNGRSHPSFAKEGSSLAAFPPHFLRTFFRT